MVNFGRTFCCSDQIVRTVEKCSKADKIVNLWYMDTDGALQSNYSDKHRLCPTNHCQLAQELEDAGVEYIPVGLRNYKDTIKEIQDSRGFNYSDIFDSSKSREKPNFDQVMKSFFVEHIHNDDEIRFVLDGSGYWDFRNVNDDWVRVQLMPGDFIIFPAGLYHRFTLDSMDYIQCMRFFAGDPNWSAVYRPEAENHPRRRSYLQKLAALGIRHVGNNYLAAKNTFIGR